MTAPWFERTVTSFERHLRAEGKAKKTVQIYTDAARGFGRWLTANTPIRDWADADVPAFETYMDVLQTGHGKGCRKDDCDGCRTPGWANQQYRALQQFFKWAASDKGPQLPVNIMTGMRPPKVPRRLIPVVRLEAWQALLDGCRHRTFMHRRDEAILRTFMSSGARLAGVAGMDLERLDLDTNTAVIVKKGGDEQVISFGAKTGYAIDRYLQFRDQHKWAKRTTALWLPEPRASKRPQSGQPHGIHTNGIYQMMRRRAAEVGIHLHPHMFRHTFAHMWLDAGGTEGDLMSLMGWTDRQMVDIYARELRDERAREEYRRRSWGDQF